MKKPLVIAIIVVVAIAGGFAYLMMQDKQADTSTTEVLQTEETPATEAPSSPDSAAQAGAYVDYQASSIASTPGTKILFFHAPWCPQCRQLESEIKAGQLPAGTTIFKVDYDTNQALRQKYGVTLQTTLVKVDDQGNQVQKYVAYDDPTLAALEQNIF